METKTVYLPITLETESKISDDQAKRLVDTMKSMIEDGSYNSDNMFDNAMEFNIPLSDVIIGESKSFNDVTSM